ncbi:MAG: DUF2085 domain-containing protein [Caldilineae bacterium]|nr:MAG: DUF2085 domain-containing protein [Caldilineae bacterium]
MSLPDTPDLSPLTSPSTARTRSVIARAADGLVTGVARHWLALVNVAVAVYLLLPFLAPAFMHWGYQRPAQAIYGLYSFACHQLPDHSYFLFGAEPFYSLATLEASGLPEGLDLLQRRRFVGNALTGYKVAICQRDVAIYGAVFLAGLLFGLLRRRVRPLPWKVYLLFLIPIGLDGLTQLVGLRESNWWLRTLTGALFGGASVWLAYPFLDEAMRDVLRVETQRRQNEKQAA